MPRAQQPAAAPDWSGWENWADAKISAAVAAERKTIVKIVGKALGDFVGDAVERERALWQTQLRELRQECAKLSSTVDELYSLLSADRTKTVIVDLLARRIATN